MISKFKIKKFLRDKKEKIYIKLFRFSMKRVFPWYDYSYLYGMMYEWLNNAYTIYDSDGVHEGSLQISEEMKRASEICKSMANDDFFNVDEEDIPLKELTDLLRDRSFNWWN